MIEATSDDAKINGIARIGSQPIALAAAALVIIVIGAGSIALWRAYSGTSPEQDRKPPRRSRSTSCRLFRISCRPQNASLPHSKRKTSGCLSRLETSPAQSTVLSSRSRAPRLPKHPVRARPEARADQDTTPGITGPPDRDADTVPILGNPDASHPAAFFAPTVKWITQARAPPVHSIVHRAAQADFNVRAGQGRTGVILRRRPCFLRDRIGPTTSTHPLSSQAGDLCFAGIAC
jgi:hypothetical protein